MCDKVLALKEPNAENGLDLIKTIGAGRLNFSNEGWCWKIENDKFEVVLKYIRLDSNVDFLLIPNQDYSEEFMDEFISYIKFKEWQNLDEVAIFKKLNYEFRHNGQDYKIDVPVYLCCAENSSDVSWYQSLITRFYNWETFLSNRDELCGYSKSKHLFGVEDDS